MPLELNVVFDVHGKIKKLLKTSSDKSSPCAAVSEKNVTKDMRITEDFNNQEITHLKASNYLAYLTVSKERELCSALARYDGIDRKSNASGREITPENSLRSSLNNCFKGLFLKKKKEENPQNKIKSDISTVSTTEAFKALLQEKSALNSLIGKEIALNTVMTIKSVEGDENPNLVLSGTIPINISTNNGIIKKNVHVKGKLFANKNDYGAPEIETSTQRLSILKVNQDFKKDTSKSQKVDWLTSLVFTQEKYEQLKKNMRLEQRTSGLVQNNEPSDLRNKKTGFDNVKRRSPECAKYPSRTDRSKLPLASVSIARSKTRVRFADGTDIGRNLVTMTFPKGSLHSQIRKTANKGDLEAGVKFDQVFMGSCFQMLRDEIATKVMSPRLPEKERFSFHMSNNFNSGTRIKELDGSIFYPTYDYSEILKDKYNPAMWIYKHFDKTKRFVREFAVFE